MVRLVLAMMVKNEEDVLEKTLETILPFADLCVILDTGSTDSTKEICRKATEKHQVRLIIETREFVDFSTSRNVLLDMVENYANGWWCLTLDANDEVINGAMLKPFLDKIPSDFTAFHVPVFWGEERLEMAKLFRSGYGFRYIGKIHEVLNAAAASVDYFPKDIFIYQDRSKDNHKTLVRHSRDIEAIKEELELDPGSKKYTFYMAHTLCALQRYDEAIIWYEKRAAFGDVDIDECFISDQFLDRLLFNQDSNLSKRAERLKQLCQRYKRPEFYRDLAMTFLEMQKFEEAKEAMIKCCKVPYPENASFCVNENLLRFWRWCELHKFLEEESELAKDCIRNMREGALFFRSKFGEESPIVKEHDEVLCSFPWGS